MNSLNTKPDITRAIIMTATPTMPTAFQLILTLLNLCLTLSLNFQATSLIIIKPSTNKFNCIVVEPRAPLKPPNFPVNKDNMKKVGKSQET